MSEVRLFDLLADRATQGLSAGDSVELDRLLADAPDVDAFEFERVAGAIDAALASTPDEALPADLRARIETDAQQVLASNLVVRNEARSLPRTAARRAPAPRRRWLSALGWAAAAVLAGLLFLPPTIESGRDPVDLRAELLTADAMTVAWSPTGDVSGPEASGDVVRSSERQSGVMRFRGLVANDPAAFQYQLWIFDETRDERYPIDGGVFDVIREGEDVYVAIDPKLHVRNLLSSPSRSRSQAASLCPVASESPSWPQSRAERAVLDYLALAASRGRPPSNHTP